MHYRIRWRGLGLRLRMQFRYYAWGYFKRERNPFPVSGETKFNPLQAFSYALVMYTGIPLLLITGWGLLFPEILLDRIFGINGLMLTDLLHVIAGFVLSIFMFVHLYLCTIGINPRNKFRAIITGWHESEIE